MLKHDKTTYDYYISISDDALKRIYQGETISSVAESYGLNDKRLRVFLLNHKGYDPSKVKKPGEITTDILRKAFDKYDNGECSITAIATELKVNRKKLSRMLKENYNVEVRLDGKKVVKSDYFSNIDTDDKAYWLGIMYSDGYVSPSNGIELCLKDKEHIKKFKKAIGSTHSISKKTSIKNGKEFVSWRISIRDSQMARDLKSHGCINNKSLVVQLPQLREEMMPGFFRGFFDGDGSFTVHKNKQSAQVLLTSGSLDMLEQIKDYLYLNLKIHAHISKDKRTETTYRLCLSQTAHAINFLEYIYEFSTENSRLDRKYSKFEQFIIAV